MPVVSLIKFTQGSNTDVAGRALRGKAGSAVIISNGSDAGVGRWIFTLLDVPADSGLAVGMVQDSLVLSSYSFTPDVSGSYRWKLEVRDALDTESDTDIRVFSIPEAHQGLIIPPYQMDPSPLPTLASGDAGNKPNELNFGGHETGWAGKAGPRLIDDFIRRVAASDYDAIQGPKGNLGTVLQLQLSEALGHPIAVVGVDTGDAWVCGYSFGTTNAGFYRLQPSGTRLPVESVFHTNPDMILLGGTQVSGAVWVSGFDQMTNNGYVVKLTPGSPSTITTTLIAVNRLLTAFVYDGTYLWGADTFSSAGLYRITPASPGGPYTILLAGQALMGVYFDDTSVYGDTNPRILVTAANGTIRRVDLTGPAVDDTLVTGNLIAVQSSYALSVGGGYIWVVGLDASADPCLTRLTHDPLTYNNQASLVANLSQVLSAHYSAALGAVLVVGKGLTGKLTMLSIDPVALTVSSTTELGPSSFGYVTELDDLIWLFNLTEFTISRFLPELPLEEHSRLNTHYVPVPGTSAVLSRVETGAATYQMLAGTDYVGVDTVSSACVVTLPDYPVDGQVAEVKDSTGGATTNNITVQPGLSLGGPTTIDGDADYTIAINYGHVRLVYQLSNDFWSIS